MTTNEIKDAPHKEVVGVIEKQNSTLEVQIYGVHVGNARVMEVKGAAIDFDTLVEVVVG